MNRMFSFPVQYVTASVENQVLICYSFLLNTFFAETVMTSFTIYFLSSLHFSSVCLMYVLQMNSSYTAKPHVKTSRWAPAL